MKLNTVVGSFLSGIAKAMPPTVQPISTQEQAINVATTGQFFLGTQQSAENAPRDRQQIYTKLQRMAKFAPIAEALKIHITTALGGDSYTNKTIFIKPATRLRKEEKELSKLDKQELDKIKSRIGKVENLVNRNIFKVCHDAIVYGDAYVRVYGKKKNGLVGLVCDHRTQAPLIMGFEQGSTPVGFLVQNNNPNSQKQAVVLNEFQMKRLRIQPIIEINQQDIIDNINYAETLLEDDIDNLAILPSKIGGSFLLEVEDIFDNIITCLTALTTQQIADSVKRMIVSINQENMSPAQREQYMQYFQSFLDESEAYTREAMERGKALYQTQFGALPQMGEKQAINFVGDITGERTPINTEVFMINVRLLMGGLGLDPSFVGWTDLITGGLGESGALHSSIQTMQRSQRIRMDAKEYIDSVILSDWFFAFGEQYTDQLDYPWEIEFYSDQTASMTEQLANQNQRIQASMGMLQVFEQAKALGMTKEYMISFFERRLGLDFTEAEQAVDSLLAQANSEQPAGDGGFNE